MTVIAGLHTPTLPPEESLWRPEPERPPEPGSGQAVGQFVDEPVVEAGSGLSVYAQSLLLCAAVLTANLAYLRYFGERSFLIGTSAAAAGGVALTALTAPRRWPTPVKLVLSALGFTLVGVFAVYRQTLKHGVPTGHTFSALGTGLRSGWSEMLSTNLPADAVGDLVVVPALIAWVAAAASTALLLRTRAVLPPLIGPVAAFGAGLLFTAGWPVNNPGLAAALVAELALVALVRAGTTDPRRAPVGHGGAGGSGGADGSGSSGGSGGSGGADSSHGRVGLRSAAGRLVFGLPVVILAAAVAVASVHLVPLTSGKDRYDLRDHVSVRCEHRRFAVPAGAAQSAVARTGQRPVHGEGLRRRDQRRPCPHRRSGRLRRRVVDVERPLPARRARAADGHRDREPAAGHAQRQRREPDRAVSAGGRRAGAGHRARFGYSPDSTTLATDAPSIAGLHYDLTADVAPSAGLAAAVPSEAGGAGADTALPPGLPPEIRAEGAVLAGSVAQPYAKLTAIQDYLRKLPYDLDTRPGHSYDALRRLFGTDPADQAGYAEQFAAAFAVLARSQGFPTRVAVGYLLNPAHKHGDTYTVTTHDAHAWPEVDLAGYGWVAFEPTDPEHHTNPVAPQPKQKTNTTGTQNTPMPKPAQPAVDPNLKAAAGGGVSALDWALFVLIALGALVLLTPITIAMEKLRRRRKRHTGSRAARIIGAWQDALDRLAEHGLPMTASNTAAEVAWRATELFGDRAAPVAALAPLMMSAAYNPMEPDDAMVAEAWALSARLRRELRSSRGLMRAFGAWFDPRPLVARSVDSRRRGRAMAVLTKG